MSLSSNPSAALSSALEDQRRKLLDIGKRNPLTNAPITKNRRNQLRIVDELANEIFRLLWKESRTFTFLPRDSSNDSSVDGEDESTEDLPPIDYVPPELEGELDARHTDTKLQTLLLPSELHTKLIYQYREAKTIEEEQGASVLFLAMGFLKYFESDSSSVERYAPLLLVPVNLNRTDNRATFTLKARDDDISSNECLSMMCREDFDIQLPDLNVNDDDWLPSVYFEDVTLAISGKPRWTVEPNRMALSFFSFGRFLMYRDLDTAQAHTEVVQQLLIGANEPEGSAQTSITAPYEHQNLDATYADPRDLGHILDADTSQTRVIAAAANNDDIVVQGPPGTGKSQTITNMIAVAVKQGKKVLFVAEKRAALDVVKKRLELCGLGPLCLELHSHKANRKAIYDDLRATLELGRPVDPAEEHYESLIDVRDRLNHLADLVHSVDETTGNTAYRLMGRIAFLVGKGTPLVEMDIPDLAQWTIAEFDERRALVASYVTSVSQHGSENEHVWRGFNARLNVLTQQRLQTAIADTTAKIEGLRANFTQHAQDLNLDWTFTLRRCQRLCSLLEHLQAMPKSVPRLAADDLLVENLPAMQQLLELLKRYQTERDELRNAVSRAALEQDWETQLHAFKGASSSIFRIFNAAYRSAVNALKSVSLGKLPSSMDERQTLLERLHDAAELRREIAVNDSLGRACFEHAWQQHDTEYESFDAIVEWVLDASDSLDSMDQLQTLVLTVNAGTPDLSNQAIGESLSAFIEAFTQLQSVSDLDLNAAFSEVELDDISLNDILDRLIACNQNFDRLDGYQDLIAHGRALDSHGLQIVRQFIRNGALDLDTAVDSFTLLRSQVVIDNIFNQHPELNELQNVDRSELVERFQSLDGELQQLAAQEIARTHYENMPRGASGKVGVVRGELNKKRRQMPIRQLLNNAGDVIVAIKPIFLMSPLSVAQFLTIDGIKFDLLLIDEASQVKPAEALGCIARAKQLVVVGDQKQLPPTSFFDRQISGEDRFEESAEELDTGELIAQQSADMESILTLCDARGMQNEMLNWHYRSEHPSLIEVSNVEFYQEKLAFPPSPHDSQTRGLQFEHVANGVYSRGKQRNNDIEADRVCERVVEFIQQDPSRTIGVVTLSTAQRDLVQQKMDRYCREMPDVESYCNPERDEPFFVKNLENVQGDERDVIFVSIGYGRDENGYFAQSFGPVSSEGGERRLNVLFTRARSACRIFASIKHEDIRLDAAKFDGPRILKRFLKYAETGDLDVPHSVTGEMDSPFEEDVAAVLQEHGFDVHPQVGSGGFRIDLAVVNPDDTRNYLIAIECDGARYHSSSWARERDRLRQQVLEGKGWVFHRIWSTDWFYSRDAEVKRLLDAIEQQRIKIEANTTAARSIGASAAATTPSTGELTNETTESPDPSLREPSRRDPISREHPTNAKTSGGTPYSEYRVSVPVQSRALPFLDVRESELGTYAQLIIKHEGPIHTDVLTTRLRLAWDLKRSGRQIQAKVQDILKLLRTQGRIKETEPGFWILADDASNQFPIRSRSDVQLSQLKDPRYIAPNEIRDALVSVVEDNFSISIEEATKEVGRLLGTNHGRSEMHNLVSQHAATLAANGAIGVDGHTLERT